MSKRVVIFGAGQTAETVATIMLNDHGNPTFWRACGWEPVCLTADREFLPAHKTFNVPVNAYTHKELPIVPFDEVAKRYNPNDYSAFVAVSYTGINARRAEAMERMKALGYTLANYISGRATVYPDLVIGDNVLVLENNVIQPRVEIGDGTFLWSGNHVGHHTKIGKHVFVASQAVISGAVEIGDRCFVGVNATIRDNIKIGARSVIGMGARVKRDCPDETVFDEAATEPSKVPSSRLRGI